MPGFRFTEESQQSECELNLALRKIERIFKGSRGQQIKDRCGIFRGETFRGGGREINGNHIGFGVDVATLGVFFPIFP